MNATLSPSRSQELYDVKITLPGGEVLQDRADSDYMDREVQSEVIEPEVIVDEEVIPGDGRGPVVVNAPTDVRVRLVTMLNRNTPKAEELRAQPANFLDLHTKAC